MDYLKNFINIKKDIKDQNTKNNLIVVTKNTDLEKIKSIPDYCAVAKQYKNLYNVDMLSDIDGDFDLQSDWAEYIHKPLTKAVEYSNKMAKSGSDEISGWGDKTPERDPGSGDKDPEAEDDDDSDDLSYVACSGEFYKGCKDPISGGEIKRLQGCLGLEQTGKYDSKLDDIVQSELKKSKINSSDISSICGDL